jgi:hypothetical protein
MLESEELKGLCHRRRPARVPVQKSRTFYVARFQLVSGATGFAITIFARPHQVSHPYLYIVTSIAVPGVLWLPPLRLVSSGKEEQRLVIATVLLFLPLKSADLLPPIKREAR